MFDKRKPLPLPPMGFRDVRFEVVHVDEEPCLRSDQIGEALQFDPPEPEILELYQAHRGHFSDFITRVVAVTVDGQARPMRVFTLWGALTLAKRAETPEAPAFEAWITELLMLRGYSLQWEIIRLHGENGDLWGKLHDLEARLRLATLRLDELRTELETRRREETVHLDGEFRRLSEEQRAGFAALAEWLTERWESPPNQDAGLRSLFGSLLEAVEGLCERTGMLEPASEKPKPGAGEKARREPREREEEEWEPPFDPARAVVASVGPFTVYAATLSGYDCRLINGRELWTGLDSKQQFSTWMKDRIAWYGFRERVDYVLVQDHGNFNRMDYYLRLGAALDLVWFDRSPRAGEVHAELVKVASHERGYVIEGEAARVREGIAETATPADGALVSVEFHKRTLLSFKHNGEVYVAMKPLVESMGLDWKSQYARMKRDEVLSEGMVIMTIPTAGGHQEVIGLPLKLLNGWLFGIDTKRVKEEIREDIIAYRRKCYDVLYRYWHGLEQAQRPAIRTAQSILPDTPPERPLAFKFHDGKKAVRIRVAIENGRPWFLLKDLGAVMSMKWGEARGTFASMPAELRRLLPIPTGERNEPALSEAGLWFFLGNWRGLSNAGLLRNWMIDDIFPALDARRTAPASESTPAPPPLPPEVHYTHRDPLQMTFVALADALLRAEGHPFHTAPVNHGRFLAWLWRNAPAGDWLDVRNRTRFAAAVGIDRRSLGRVLERVVGWDLAEQSPAPEAESPLAWPTRIRLRREQVLAALRKARLEAPEA
jgi:phage anti-repressor protein/prophage antirepressor-like protein